MPRKYTTCPHCHENTRVRTFAPDRVELEKEKGERFMVKCNNCHETREVHVNQVRAKPNYLAANVVSVLISLIWIIIFISGAWANMFVLLLASALIGLPFAFRHAADRVTASFNNYEVRPTGPHDS